MAKRTKELLIPQNKLDPKKWKTTPAGFQIYTLWQHPETGATISLFKCPKGSGVPVRHVHASNQFMYCLEGEYAYTATGVVLKPGSFYMNPKGHPHGPTKARKDSLMLEMYDGPHYFERPVYHSEKTVGPIAAAVKKAKKKTTAKQAVPAKKKASAGTAVGATRTKTAKKGSKAAKAINSAKPAKRAKR